MTQEPYTVSILVPVYGVEKYIERCARSIFEQKYRNPDIVFVDDCTPDKSIDILKRVLEDYPKRKAQTRIIRHEQNRGFASSLPVLSHRYRTGFSHEAYGHHKLAFVIDILPK